MRKVAATALTALTLSLMGSAAAFADAQPGYGPGSGYTQPRQEQRYNGPMGPNGPVAPRPHSGGQQGGYHDQWSRDGRFDRDYGGEQGFDDHRFDRDNRFDLRFDFGRHNGNFDRWERGWGYNDYGQFRHGRPLNRWQLVRRLEAQGFYGVRGLKKARFGFGLRAFAFNHRGMPVMLRVNPFTGRVMDARYIGQYGYRY
jgi:hypothetical protein